MARSRLFLILTVLVVLALGAGAIWWTQEWDDQPERDSRRDLTGSVSERACDVPRSYLNRIWRGYDPERSEELAIVPRQPNFIGTFDLTSHSGPWDYLQNVPLVLYGPPFIENNGEISNDVAMADVYPTVENLVDKKLTSRDGRVLDDALGNTPSLPKLIVVVVWDGTGRRTLTKFPERWPRLARLSDAGTSYTQANVGTSPSVTSAVHSTLGTGAWPRDHGIIGNELRTPSGGLTGTFEGLSPDQLRMSTFADQVDLAFGNRSKVGMLAWNKWHLGMLGHGDTFPGGDKDEMALIHYAGGLKINSAGNFQPVSGLDGVVDLSTELEELDRADGTVDNEWLGNDITLGDKAEWDTYSNPAWAEVQSKLAVAMLKNGNYGQDEVPDIWLTNFKMTDLAGHKWGRDSQEMAEVLEAQDKALGDLVDYLEREVDDYVLMLTADHGAAPDPRSSGAWPIDQVELMNDVDRNFDVAEDEDLLESAAAAAYFVDEEIAQSVDVTVQDIAAFLNGYTIAENWTEEDLPEGYEGRGSEQVFSAAFATEDLKKYLSCSRGN